MYHQRIPSYDGAQPFIYAVYCKEDEALAYPVLARMYNEGFRVYCAPSTGISSDYYTQQRMASAAGIVMFMSRIMAERLRLGDPDALAAARSPMLRTIVLLDETDVSNNIFAMSVPDHQQYLPQNDSAFWLYVYSNDYFDNCRGKWPQKQLLLRDPVYENVNAEVVSEEYRQLESIMSVSSGQRKPFDPFDPGDIYRNNVGYVEPQPDEYTYEPLARISAVRTEHDDQLDEVLGLINEAENAVEQSRLRTEQASAAAAQAAQDAAQAVSDQEARFLEERANDKEPEPISIFGGTAADAKPEQAVAEEAPIEKAPEQAIEAVAEPVTEEPVQVEEKTEEKVQAEPKADLIVTPVEKVEAPLPEKTVEVAPIEEPLPEISEEESAAAAETIMASAETLLEDEPEEAEVIAESAPQAEVTATEMPVEPVVEAPRARRSSVPVMVRRQQHRRIIGKVEVKKRRTVHLSSTPTTAHRSAMHLSSVPSAEGVMPRAISDSITFEQYVRDIARSCVSELLVAPEEPAAPQPPARKHRQRISAVVHTPAEVPVQTEETPAQAVPAAEDEGKSARKNRHPHQKTSFFNSIVNALRSNRRQPEASAENEVADNAEQPYDSDKGESAELSNQPTELQSVVEKFIESNAVPSVTVVPRTMVRRYRD